MTIFIGKTRVKKNLKITYLKKSGHVASNLSIVDILVVLYKDFVKKKTIINLY